MAEEVAATGKAVVAECECHWQGTTDPYGKN
jgi:hypothetical protein